MGSSVVFHMKLDLLLHSLDLFLDALKIVLYTLHVLVNLVKERIEVFLLLFGHTIERILDPLFKHVFIAHIYVAHEPCKYVSPLSLDHSD